MKKLSLPAAASLVFVGALSAQNVLVNFDTASTDFTGNFTASTGTTTGFTWNNAAGVGAVAGGGVTVSTDTGGANYNYNTAYDFGTAGGPTSTWTVSAFFKTNATTGTSANQVAGVGVLGAATDEFSAGGRFVGITLRQGTASTADLSLATTYNVSGTQFNDLRSTVFTPTTNNWYKLSVTITKTSTADQFTVSGSVEDWGANGTSAPGSALRSFSAVTVTNSTLYADTTTYGGFFARQTSGNPIQIASVDNFAMAIPEPSTFAALAGLASLALAATRRRRLSSTA